VVPDPFGTAALRRVVLDAWSASPDRFREDANAEEALAVGGYAGRVLVELAANAADAAMEAGVPARIRVRLQGDELRVANTGAPLTTAGVAALASLRASAKRETLTSVGHFGVGFTAVLSWSTAPRVVSSSGGIRFDGAETRACIAQRGVAELDREVALRGGQVPVLRLPWPTGPAEPPPPEGYTTEVRLPLEPVIAAEVAWILADDAFAEDLFWAVRALGEIDLPGRVVRCGVDLDGMTVITDGDVARRYRTAERFGEIPAELLADRPIEERLRSRWRITWARPVAADGVEDELATALRAGDEPPAPMTIGAPTPTDEPLTFPARLIGSFPVDDTRRRLASGPLADYLLDRAADTYLDLIAETEPGGRWELLPAAGFPAGPVDAALLAAVQSRVATTPLLRSAAGDLLTPAAACLLPGLGATGAVLIGQAVPGLLAPVSTAAAAVLRRWGVDTLSWSQASAALAGIDREPAFWWQVYEAAATAERPPTADDLADIPIPLTGGRRATGARGCLLPGTSVEPDLARRAGAVVPAMRIVDPLAVHPLLERLGARAADADALLADPGMVTEIDRIRTELERDDPDPDEVRDLGEVVLDLLAAGGRAGRAVAAEAAVGVTDGPGWSGGGPGIIGELVLTDVNGDPWPAGELLVPGAPLAAVLADDVDRPFVGAEWADRYSAEVLVAAGVRSGFGVVRAEDGAAIDADLPGLDEWLELHGSGDVQVTALADLDLVDPQRWAAALDLIAGDREARACLAPTATGLSYSGWWLSRHALLAGRPPSQWRLPDALDLVGLYDPLPGSMDPVFAWWIGVQSGLASAVAGDAPGVLDRLADATRTVPAAAVAGITGAVVHALSTADPDLPNGVRTVGGVVVDAVEAMVLDEPWWAQLVPPTVLVPGAGDPALVGRVLDLPMVSAELRATVIGAGAGAGPLAGTADQAVARLRRAAEAVGLDLATVQIEVVDPLLVALDGADPAPVRWWGVAGRWWVDGSAESCGRAVAWAAGDWPARHRAAAAADQDFLALAEDGLSSVVPTAKNVIAQMDSSSAS
jgi:hypothetical protein